MAGLLYVLIVAQDAVVDTISNAADEGVIGLLSVMCGGAIIALVYIWRRSQKDIAEKDEQIAELNKRLLEREREHAKDFRQESIDNRDTLRDLAEYFDASTTILKRIEKDVPDEVKEHLKRLEKTVEDLKNLAHS